MQLSTITTALERIAPLQYAESWDNVGLLIGDSHQETSAALLAIDYTPDVAAEAIEKRCDLVIAYHPPLFKPIKRLNEGSLLEAARRGIAIYSPHTAWDAAPGGANDFLANVLMMTGAKPLRLFEGKAKHCKLIVYVPIEAEQRVCDALFAAGAGHTGHYDRCSFRSPGTGTFRGDETTHPAIGEPLRDERVDELRMEVIVPLRSIDRVVDALRAAHPYEEPAFDLIPTIDPPSAFGYGRIGRMPGDLTADMLINHIQRELDLDHVLVAGPVDRMIKTVACCAGAGGELLDDAIAKKADLYLTGEMRHHDALRAAALGMVIVCTLHSNSERASLKRLREKLLAALPEFPVHLSEADRDPFQIR